MLRSFIHEGEDSWLDSDSLSKILGFADEDLAALMFVYELEWEPIPDEVRASLGLEAKKGASAETVMKLCTVVTMLGLRP
jgi:hypothetical protein